MKLLWREELPGKFVAIPLVDAPRGDERNGKTEHHGTVIRHVVNHLHHAERKMQIILLGGVKAGKESKFLSKALVLTGIMLDHANAFNKVWCVSPSMNLKIGKQAP